MRLLPLYLSLFVLACFKTFATGINLFEEDKRVLNVAAFAAGDITFFGDQGSFESFKDTRAQSIYKSGKFGNWTIDTYPLNKAGEDGSPRYFGRLKTEIDGTKYVILAFSDWKPGPDEIVAKLKSSEYFKSTNFQMNEIGFLPMLKQSRNHGCCLQGVQVEGTDYRNSNLLAILNLLHRSHKEDTHVLFTGAGHGGALACYLMLQYAGIRYKTALESGGSSVESKELFQKSGGKLGVLTFGALPNFSEEVAFYFNQLFSSPKNSMIDISGTLDPRPFLGSSVFVQRGVKGFLSHGQSVGWDQLDSGTLGTIFTEQVEKINASLLRGHGAEEKEHVINQLIIQYGNQNAYALYFMSIGGLSPLEQLKRFPEIEHWGNDDRLSEIWEVHASGSPPNYYDCDINVNNERTRFKPTEEQIKEREEAKKRKQQEKEEWKRQMAARRAEKEAFKERQRQHERARSAPFRRDSDDEARAASREAEGEKRKHQEELAKEKEQRKREAAANRAKKQAFKEAQRRKNLQAFAAPTQEPDLSSEPETELEFSSAAQVHAPENRRKPNKNPANERYKEIKPKSSGRSERHSARPDHQRASEGGGGAASAAASGASASPEEGKGFFSKVRTGAAWLSNTVSEAYEKADKWLEEDQRKRGIRRLTPAEAYERDAAMERRIGKIYDDEKKKMRQRYAFCKQKRQELNDKIRSLNAETNRTAEIQWEEYYTDKGEFGFWTSGELNRARSEAQRLQKSQRAEDRQEARTIMQNYHNLKKRVQERLQPKRDELKRTVVQRDKYKAEIERLSNHPNCY